MLAPAMGEDCRQLDEQLIPLSVAAAVAYLDIASLEAQARPHHYVVRAIDLAALSLAQLVPVYLSDAGRRELSAQEVHERLLDPLFKGDKRPSLDKFLVRRRDLRAAIKTLREAGARFH
jgi:hypothetical protein